MALTSNGPHPTLAGNPDSSRVVALVWALICLCLVRPATATELRVLHIAHSPALTLEQKGGVVRLRYTSSGSSGRVGRLTLEDCAPCKLQTAALVAELPGRALLLTVTYWSRPKNPGGMCGAGEEIFLYVVSLAGGQLRETLALPIASCWSSIEPGEAGVRWIEQSSTVALDLTTFTPDAARNEHLAFRIGPDGGAIRLALHE